MSDKILEIASFKTAIQFKTFLGVATHQAAMATILPLIAVVTSILAAITVLVASYLVITRPESLVDLTKTMDRALSDTPKENWQSFTSSDFHEFLKRFLLPDEVAVFEAMANFLILQGIDLTNNQYNQEDVGWMNKHNILKESNVSQKRMYGRTGIIDRMESLELVEKKDSNSSWGGMKFLYRLKIDNDFIKAYVLALQKKKKNNSYEKQL